MTTLTHALAHLRDRLWRAWQRRLKLRRFDRRRADFLRYATQQNRAMGWDE
jgi:hypothetical protein